MLKGNYRFAISSSLGNGTFSTSTPDTNAVDNKPLFCFVAETTGLVGTGGTSCTVNDIELTVFPATNSEKKTEHIGLFVLVELYTN
jgi:hypothetical protein